MSNKRSHEDVRKRRSFFISVCRQQQQQQHRPGASVGFIRTTEEASHHRSAPQPRMFPRSARSQTHKAHTRPQGVMSLSNAVLKVPEAEFKLLIVQRGRRSTSYQRRTREMKFSSEAVVPLLILQAPDPRQPLYGARYRGFLPHSENMSFLLTGFTLSSTSRE